MNEINDNCSENNNINNNIPNDFATDTANNKENKQPDIIILTPQQLKIIEKQNRIKKRVPLKNSTKNFLMTILTVCICIMLAFILYTSFAKPNNSTSNSVFNSYNTTLPNNNSSSSSIDFFNDYN